MIITEYNIVAQTKLILEVNEVPINLKLLDEALSRLEPIAPITIERPKRTVYAVPCYDPNNELFHAYRTAIKGLEVGQELNLTDAFSAVSETLKTRRQFRATIEGMEKRCDYLASLGYLEKTDDQKYRIIKGFSSND